MTRTRFKGLVAAASAALFVAALPADTEAMRGGRGIARSGGRSIGSIRGSGLSAVPRGAGSVVSPVAGSASDAARGSYGTTRGALRGQSGISPVPQSAAGAAATGATRRVYGGAPSPERRDARREAASQWYDTATPAQRAAAAGAVRDHRVARAAGYAARAYDDDYWHDQWWYGYYPAETYVVSDVPCDAASQTVGGTTYRRCGDTWYEPNYYEGDVVWVVRAPPPGTEAGDAEGLEPVIAGARQYYYSDGTFYQRRLENGRLSYFVVEPPLGAQVNRLPRDAVEVEGGQGGLFRCASGYYLKKDTPQGPAYELVPPPS